jgi:hypothetical protein
MKKKLYFFLFIALSFFSCDEKQKDNVTPSTDDKTYTIEKFTCNEKDRYFSWRCSYTENYLQKNITNVSDATYLLQFSSDNFSPTGFGFRVTVFVNNIIRFRRLTREFPFETTLIAPQGSLLTVRTYVETYDFLGNATEQSGNVNCKVSCDK